MMESLKTESGRQRSEDRDRKTEIGRRRSEDGIGNLKAEKTNNRKDEK